MEAVAGDSRKAGYDVSSDVGMSRALHCAVVAQLRGKAGLRHRFRGKASQVNWDWTATLDAILA